MPVEMRLRRMRYEILTTAGNSHRERHADGSAFIAVTIHFVSYRVAGATVAVISRITILGDEVWNDSVKAGVAIISRPRECEKVPYRYGCLGAEQLEADGATNGVDGRGHRLTGVGGHYYRAYDALVPREWSGCGWGIAPCRPDGDSLSCGALEWVARHRYPL